MYNIKDKQLRKFVISYVETLLWSEGDQFGDYSYDDFTDTAKEEIISDCESMLYDETLQTLLSGGLYTVETAGHDFALTRNDHGAGYWDRGLGDIGELLTKEAKAYGAMHVVVIEDEGKLDIHG